MKLKGYYFIISYNSKKSIKLTYVDRKDSALDKYTTLDYPIVKKIDKAITNIVGFNKDMCELYITGSHWIIKKSDLKRIKKEIESLDGIIVVDKY